MQVIDYEYFTCSLSITSTGAKLVKKTKYHVRHYLTYATAVSVYK
jgi:hypothetical protein